ncbi:MAG: iron ABC transporter permease [Candidatus Brockarchaeota archaeon]|nr:iron ABC transporter permease [Candidatus Brockarchaeota archaeon]
MLVTKQESDRLKKGLVTLLDRLSENKTISYLIYLASVIFFFGIILLPSLLGVLLKIGVVQEVFQNTELFEKSISAVFSSILLATLVSVLDVAAGLPLAWLIAKKRYKWISFIDYLTDLPMIIPTVILGYSALMLWCEEAPFSILGFPRISPGFLTVLLLHFSFSYPVVVRVLVGKLMELDATYEIAARVLGASSFTTARTVSIPMIKSGIIASLILSFARSLSETGATIMVAGSFENGPVFIKRSIDAGLVSPMVFVSLMLIFLSVLILLGLRLFGLSLRIPFRRAYRIELVLSSEKVVYARDVLTILVFILFIFIPSSYIVIARLPLVARPDLIKQVFLGEGIWASYWSSVINSYVIGLLATLINVLFSLPMAIIISRRRLGRTFSRILDALSNVSIIMPSVALGVSIGLFWGSSGIPDFFLVLLAHLCITYPYMVATMVSALEDLPVELEEAGRTLGGTPFKVFRSITLPVAKYSFLSGAILTFTRSVNETGATLAVSKTFKTVSVLLVEWVKSPVMRVESGMGTLILMLLSLIFLIVFKYIYSKGGGMVA